MPSLNAIVTSCSRLERRDLWRSFDAFSELRWSSCWLLAIFGGGWLVGRLGIGSVVNPASLSEVERQFTERMRDVTHGRLVHGRRTVNVSDHE